MAGDGSISQRHMSASIRSQRGIFDELLVAVKFFIAIVHQPDLNQAIDPALLCKKTRQGLCRACSLEYNILPTVFDTKYIPKNFCVQNYSHFRTEKQFISPRPSEAIPNMTTNPQPNNPLHSITLETMLNQLVKHYGWLELGERIPIKCFTDNASIKSSLKFLRQTPWARKKVEDLYLKSIANAQSMGAIKD